MTTYIIESYVYVNISDDSYLLFNTLNSDSIVGNNKIIRKLLVENIDIFNVIHDVDERNEIIYSFILECSLKLMLYKYVASNIYNTINTVINRDYRNSDLIYEDIHRYVVELHINYSSNLKSTFFNYIDSLMSNYPFFVSINIDIDTLDKYDIDSLLLETSNIFDSERVNYNIITKNSYDVNNLILFYNIINKFNKSLTVSSNYLINNFSKINKNSIKIHVLLDDINHSNIILSKSSNFELLDFSVCNKTNNLDILFIDRQQILSNKYDMHTIRANSQINTNYFGRILVENGNYVCPYSKQKLSDTSEDIRFVIRKLLKEDNSSWYLTRKKSNDCNQCLFNCMCPPIGVLEANTGIMSPCTCK